MIPLARQGFSEQDIINALHARYGSRESRFRYKLLDSQNREKGYLSNVTGGSVRFSAFSDIKRTATFSTVEDGGINYLSDRIQPIFEILVKGSWVAFPLGVFLLATPSRSDGENVITREIEAYDGLLILIDDKFSDPYTVTAGTNYKTAMINLLASAGITQYIIEDTGKFLTRTQVFEIGSTKLAAFNELSSQINFTPARVDVYGNFVSAAYKPPSERGIEYTYKDDALSITYKGMNEELDLYSVYNKWVVVATNAEEAPLKSVIVNDSPSSQTSTVNLGRTRTDYREIQDIADQEALDKYTERIANEASQIFGKITFNTAIMPHHDYMDILKVEYAPLGINDRYTETGWEFNLKAGEKMVHFARKTVTIT